MGWCSSVSLLLSSTLCLFDLFSLSLGLLDDSKVEINVVLGEDDNINFTVGI